MITSQTLKDITSHTASLLSAHMPSVVTTPTLTSAAHQNPFIIVTAVMGVIIVIISVVAVSVSMVLFIKWRQSTNSNKG